MPTRDRLFINDGDGGFVVQPTPVFDNANEVSKFFIWIDLDNDGQEELVGSHSFSSEMPKVNSDYIGLRQQANQTQRKRWIFTS